MTHPIRDILEEREERADEKQRNAHAKNGRVKRVDADDPLRLNSNLGYYTNFMNLLDLAAVAAPTGFTAAGLPFGITLFAAALLAIGLLASTMTDNQIVAFIMAFIISAALYFVYWLQFFVPGMLADVALSLKRS